MRKVREPVRRTYLIDDFELWDAAVHQAVTEFNQTYRVYPYEVRAHPTTLERFAARAAPESLRDDEGCPPEPGVDVVARGIGTFYTDEYDVPFVADESAWPITLVLVCCPEGIAAHTEDTPPPPGPDHVISSRRPAPIACRPLHQRVRYLATLCTRCRWLTSWATCVPFPDGIPLAVAQTRKVFGPTGAPRCPYERSKDWSASFEAVGAFRRGKGLMRARSDGAGVVEVPEGVGEVGTDRDAPAMPSREEVLRRASDALHEVLRDRRAGEAGAFGLSILLAEGWPVIAALLRAHFPGHDEWRIQVGLLAQGLQRAKRTSGQLALPGLGED